MMLLFLLLLSARAKLYCEEPSLDLQFVDSNSSVDLPEVDRLEVHTLGDEMVVSVIFPEGYYSLEPVQ